MSAICHGFVQNAWRKDICSNCFRVRDEHSLTEINNSVKCNATASSSGNNGVNISSIVPNNTNSNNGNKSGNESNTIGAENIGTQGRSQSLQRLNRFQGAYSSNPAINTVGSSSQPQIGPGSSGIPRINSGSSTTTIITNSSGGKFSGTNSSTSGSTISTNLSRGQTLHVTKSHNKSDNNENDSCATSSTLTDTKIKSTETIQTKTTSAILSSTTSNQPQIQGKGIIIVTNQHPSKSDNGGVIPNHNNSKQALASSAQPLTTGRNASASSVSSSSFIASKNIFNNATAPGSTGFSTTTGVSATSCIVSVNGSTVASCSGGGAAVVSASGSSGLSHSQSATSFKRGSINNFSSSSSSTSTTSVEQQSQKSGAVDVSSNSGTCGGNHKNLENFVKYGENENRREIVECVSSNSAGVIISVVNKGAMNKGRGVKQMDVTDGESTDRRKVGFASASAASTGDGDQSGVSNVKVSNVRLVTTSGSYKGILRSKNGNRRKAKSVRFPDEVVKVIGYGGGPSGISDDEDDAPPDPLDNASVAEVMEKSSTTLEEKELCRITQKNTNFNSIKTNLLGTTCIEIGPIVGCTGGKSMEGSSKPLVSIGTFETRKEPLRIHKKISEDSADDELNEKTVEKHRKFIQRGSNSSGTTTNTTIAGKTLLNQVSHKLSSMPSSNQSSGSKELEIKQRTTTTQSSSSSSVVSSTKGIISANNKATLSAFNSSTTSTLNKTSVSTSKTSSSSSNKSAATTISADKGSGSSALSTTTIEVNPEQASSTSSSSTANAIRSSKESIASVSSTETTRSKSSISQQGATTVTTNRIISSSSSSSSNSSSTTTSKWNNTIPSVPGNNEGNSLRNKPVLKRIQQQKNLSESSEAYTVNAAVVETNNSQKISSVGIAATNLGSLNGRNNLVILTNGDKSKVNSSNIASKRSSFLRDIIVDSSSSTTTIDTSGGSELGEPSGSTAVQVICKNNEEGSLMKAELKVDLKPSVNSGKLSHPPFGECLSNRSNGTDDSSEFDDSLEDSGLDIKKCSEISESDEKSGSGSDSGNENDYSERDRVKIISTGGPKSGLFISVEEVEGTNKKPEKLSPDSVLFSSASEMSASGSSESIPEALDTISNGSSQKESAVVEDNSNDNTTSAGATVKRTAPRPPPITCDSIRESNAIYANSQQASIVEVEGIYDDVSFYKNPMHFPLAKGEKISTFEEEDEGEEENIYDDCNAIAAVSKSGLKAGGKSAMGSYSFQNGSNNALDSDGEEAEKVVHRRSDGIEFIGIRKIDSESFLRERSPSPEKSPDGKRERSSSASPKTRRKVNQFFSTIGKKAGAAFSQHVHGYSSKSKSNAVIVESIEKSPSGSSSAYKRSHSTDEVSMTRTQEIYATLTPTSLKFKGLAPVLHKLSKIDLHLGDRDKGDDDDKTDSKDKRKHKLSSSIKKFLRFGHKDGGEASGNKYDFGNCHNKTDLNGPGQMITSQISEESLTDSSLSRTPTPTTATTTLASNGLAKIPERKPSIGTMSGRPPPPPPPRVHSLDLLHRVGVVGPNGTVRPARPPPPARHNRVAPSFTSVFTNPNAESENKLNGTSQEGVIPQNNGNTLHHYSTLNGDAPDPNNPPSKPKRKASMNLDCVTNGISRDLETSYNHITTLNLETLKLIASQTPTKIRKSAKFSRRSSISPMKWSQFHIPEPSKPLIQGHGFVFYAALLQDDSCVLLVQESVAAPHFSAPFEFPCVETTATFEEFIPDSYITWQASEYVTSGNSVKVFVSVMPKYNMYTVENYMRHYQIPLLHKYFALLQAMNYWDTEEMSDLLVLVQNMEESEPLSSPSSVLVYVHPIPHLSTKNGGKRFPSKTQLCTDFESSMKQILLNNGSNGEAPLLGENDRHVLLRRLNENKTKTGQEQFRLFLQVKLFTPKHDSDELERIKKLRSERAIQQWLDRERALCMKEAVEQTLQRSIESSISPYKRSYLEFLLTPENSAKAVLDMVIDLLE